MTEAAIDCLLLGAIACAVVASALLGCLIVGLALAVFAAWRLARWAWLWAVAWLGRPVRVRVRGGRV